MVKTFFFWLLLIAYWYGLSFALIVGAAHVWYKLKGIS